MLQGLIVSSRGRQQAIEADGGACCQVEAAQGEGFLRELRLRWEHHNKSMQMVRDILMVRASVPPRMREQ